MENNVLPRNIIIDVREAAIEFMDIYKPTGNFDNYDFFFLKQVLLAICPSFLSNQNFDNNMHHCMRHFADCSVHYSDETYNPSEMIRGAKKLGNYIFSALSRHNAYINQHFPYFVKDITIDLAIIFEYVSPETLRSFWNPRENCISIL